MPSSGTGCPVLKLGDQFKNWVNGEITSSPVPALDHPVLELGAPNWHSADLGVLVFQFWNGIASAGTGLTMISPFIQFQNWSPSFKLGTQFQNWVSYLKPHICTNPILAPVLKWGCTTLALQAVAYALAQVPKQDVLIMARAKMGQP